MDREKAMQCFDDTGSQASQEKSLQVEEDSCTPALPNDCSRESQTSTGEDLTTSRAERLLSIKQNISSQQSERDWREFEVILAHSDDMRRAMAVADLVSHRRMPFKVDGVPAQGWREIFRRRNEDNNNSSISGRTGGVESLQSFGNDFNAFIDAAIARSVAAEERETERESDSLKMASVDSLPPLGDAQGARARTKSQDSRKTMASSRKTSTTNSLSLPRTLTHKNTHTHTQSNKSLALKENASNPKLLTAQSSSERKSAKKTAGKSFTATDLQRMRDEEYQRELSAEKARAEQNARLQTIVHMLEQAKHDPNPSALFFQCFEIFFAMKIFDRAAVCLEKTCSATCDIKRTIATRDLPEDTQYQRKIERMSPLMLPNFLAKREELRAKLEFEESERQRLRKREAHCWLTRIYLGLSDSSSSSALALSLRDLWKAQKHLQQAFLQCVDEEEHNDMLRFFHSLIKEFFIANKGKTEFTSDKQIMRSSAGPIAEAHITILDELEKLEPDNPDFQEWLAVRYSEKCMFEEATQYFKRVRDIRRVQPDMRETLELWRLPAAADTLQDRTFKAEIEANANKSMKTVYHTPSQGAECILLKDVPVVESESSKEKEKKDLSWFAGRHTDATTIVYIPPRQGWNKDNLPG